MSYTTAWHVGQPFGLTPREQEVVRLVVEGKRQPQIAAALMISPSTAASHLKSIREKMECHNMVEIAVRWVREHELVAA